MPSTTAAISELIQRFESLLGSGGDGLPFRSGLDGTVAGTAGSALAGSDGSVASLSNGLLGSTVGLVTGLLRSLFGRDEEAASPIAAYEKPGALFFEYDVAGAPQRANEGLPVSSNAAIFAEPQGTTRGEVGSVPTVLVQVNALDAQSFSARSDDIASAVRQALARNHALRDEIWED